ncbi:hypothetical protein Plhal703r1_c43g0144631 [Plasmopara halstedii]
MAGVYRPKDYRKASHLIRLTQEGGPRICLGASRTCPVTPMKLVTVITSKSGYLAIVTKTFAALKNLLIMSV